MKIAILIATVLVLQGTDALFKRKGSSRTGRTRVSPGRTPTRMGTGRGNIFTKPSRLSGGRRPVIPGSTSNGGFRPPKFPGSGSSSSSGRTRVSPGRKPTRTGRGRGNAVTKPSRLRDRTSGGRRPVIPGSTRRTGTTRTTMKLMGKGVRTRLPAVKPKVPRKSSPQKPDLPVAEKSKMNQALDVLKQYKDIVIEGAISAVAENAATMAFDAIKESWASSNEEGAAVEVTTSGDMESAEITNQCTEEEGAGYVMEATKELLDAGQDPESPEGKQYIQDYVAYMCAENTQTR